MPKSDTKESNHFSPRHTNRGIMRFYQTHSVLVAAFVSDLDTPHLSKTLSTSGTAWEVAFTSVTIARAHPDQDGTLHVTLPPRPSRGPS